MPVAYELASDTYHGLGVVTAGAAPPPPPPPPPLRPPVALADMMVGWMGAVWVGMVVGLGAVGKVTVLVDAMAANDQP